jgi:hypothetical protein
MGTELLLHLQLLLLHKLSDSLVLGPLGMFTVSQLVPPAEKEGNLLIASWLASRRLFSLRLHLCRTLRPFRLPRIVCSAVPLGALAGSSCCQYDSRRSILQERHECKQT